jgi:hypothetical protein
MTLFNLLQQCNRFSIVQQRLRECMQHALLSVHCVYATFTMKVWTPVLCNMQRTCEWLSVLYDVGYLCVV